MCGRYALSLRAAQVRQALQDDNMPVWDAPEDEGEGAPRQTYNFAPGNHGIVYRADVPDWGAGPRGNGGARGRQSATTRPSGSQEEEAGAGDSEAQPDENDNVTQETDAVTTQEDGVEQDPKSPRYKMQSMKWGLIPFWTKRKPDYGGLMRTINCREDSLAQPGGMWASMKARKRCIVVAQGFYEWLKKDGARDRDKIPHYVKRKDGKLMCFAGLWDVVQYENEDSKQYTYTIITTESNKQLNFLHDRMPVILENGSEEMRTWLDPSRHEWSPELQKLLKPFKGELEVYPVTKDVGKVGNNSPTFIVPVDSRENKNNIANFFANQQKGSSGVVEKPSKAETVKEEDGETEKDSVSLKTEDGSNHPESDSRVKKEDDCNDKARLKPEGKDPETNTAPTGAIKREAPDDDDDEHKSHTSNDNKKLKPNPSPEKSSNGKNNTNNNKRTISATSNKRPGASPSKTSKPSAAAGTQKITKFFGGK